MNEKRKIKKLVKKIMKIIPGLKIIKDSNGEELLKRNYTEIIDGEVWKCSTPIYNFKFKKKHRKRK